MGVGLPDARPGGTARGDQPLRAPSGTAAAARPVVHREEFDGSSLPADWTWVREPDASSWSVSGGALRMDTDAGTSSWTATPPPY
ncbi:MAG: hypothetical protein ACR2GM_00345 [Nocardioidaceae bacterium]